MHHLKYPFLLFILAMLSGCTPYRATHNLAYGPDARQTYDFYEPRVDVAGTPRPALLVIHGGGYVSGDKSWAEKVAEKFCPWGYVVLGINYTLSPGGIWPAQLDDAQTALNHMRASPWMNIREPIAGFGVSAGAHLVAALHLVRDLPLAIGASGPYDLINYSNEQLDDSLRALLGLPPNAPITPAQRAILSPVSWATSNGNMLLIHAKYDPLTIFAHALSFESALKIVGAKVDLIKIDSDSHSASWDDNTGVIRRWLRENQ